MNFSDWTEAEIKRWVWLRAVEWAAFPSFLSQPLAPLFFIFYPWYFVLAAVLALNVLWSPIRYTFISVNIATFACLLVSWFKWPCSIGSAIYLFWHHQLLAGGIALAWPFLAGLFHLPVEVGVIEVGFAKRIGLVPEDATP